jgi:hypothetical protein
VRKVCKMRKVGRFGDELRLARDARTLRTRMPAAATRGTGLAGNLLTGEQPVHLQM